MFSALSSSSDVRIRVSSVFSGAVSLAAFFSVVLDAALDLDEFDLEVGRFAPVCLRARFVLHSRFDGTRRSRRSFHAGPPRLVQCLLQSQD